MRSDTQTSATMSPEIMQVTEEFMIRPAKVLLKKEQLPLQGQNSHDTLFIMHSTL